MFHSGLIFYHQILSVNSSNGDQNRKRSVLLTRWSSSDLKWPAGSFSAVYSAALTWMCSRSEYVPLFQYISINLYTLFCSDSLISCFVGRPGPHGSPQLRSNSFSFETRSRFRFKSPVLKERRQKIYFCDFSTYFLKAGRFILTVFLRGNFHPCV